MCLELRSVLLALQSGVEWMLAAGVLEDKTLQRQTPASFRSVLAGKVSGLLRLGAALAAAPLRALMLFSSVSSIMAPLGQPNYATANAMLNHWASTHAAQGSIMHSLHHWRHFQ